MDEQYDEFVARGSSRLLRTALLLTGDRTAAEDLLQDVLIQLYVHWKRVEDPGAYARTVMTRKVTDRWRAARRRPVEVAWLPGLDGQTADGAHDRAERSSLLALLAQLPVRQRAVLVLRYYEDYSEAQIALELGCSTGTVKSQAHKGLAKMRQLIGGDQLMPKAFREARS